MPSLRSALCLIAALSTLSVEARDYSYTDVHLHYVDFFQETDGMPELLKQMDKNGIQHVMISGVPVAKKWHEDEPRRPRYYAGDDASVYWYSATDMIVAHALEQLSEEQRQRFHPFLSGFNPNDKNADEHVRRMLEMYPGMWQGIGEVFTRHDDLTALTAGDTPRANSEAMDRIYYLAAEYDLPVMIHSNITSKRERNPLYLPELEESLRDHPQVRFIWAHAGTSKEIHRHQEKLTFLYDEVERLLGLYPNLYIDLSWTMLEPYLLDSEGDPDPHWLQLVERFPDRFMIGSDVVGKFGSLGEYMTGFDVFLDALPEAVAHKVAGSNFLAILPAAQRDASEGKATAEAAAAR